MVTPAHIQPEFYYLAFYAILRAIPNKTLGVLALVFAILVFALLPLSSNNTLRSTSYKPVYKYLFWIFVANFLF